MKRILTLTDLRQYIKEELGYPQLQVELTDNQLDHCIEKTVQMFCNVAYDGELTRYIKFECQGQGNYFVDPEVEEILQICQSGIFVGSDLNGLIDQNLSNYILSTSGVALSYLVTLSSTRSLVDKYFGQRINFEFNSHKGLLSIYQNYHGPLLIEAKCKYIPDEHDKIYDQEWVKAMSVAQARLMQSVVLGKYSAPLINGSQVNYSDIRQLAQDEIQRLNEELSNKFTEPAVFMVG